MHFSCGEIDGAYGANLQRTVTAFQGAHGLRPTGVVDEGTWSELNRDSSPALFEYSISQQDIAGPFVKIPEEMAAKAQLSAMGYESPQEALGEKFHANPKLLIDLNRGKPLDRAGTSILAPNVIRPAPGPAASVVVTKSDTSVVAFDAEQHILAYYSATIGSEHDPLPIGHWKILGVRRNPEFHYNPDLFWDSDPKDSKATIQPGPNNPVGVVWISLSKPHYGIHGTPEPSKIGHTESHGCIRLTNWDAMELASMVKPAMPAILRD